MELRNIGLRKFQSPKNYIGFSSGNLGLIYKYLDTTIVPVEFISFDGTIENNIVVLTWQTASELNNRGFQIEKSFNNANWLNIGLVEGNGTTTNPNTYTFIDDLFLNHNPNHNLFYRLKQIDYDGSFKYSRVIEIEVLNPTDYILYQNFPNPFNPTTTIKFDLPKDGLVTLEVYDILGRKITTLINEQRIAGRYEQTFDASSLVSGVYVYKINAGDFISSKKMILIK